MKKVHKIGIVLAVMLMSTNLHTIHAQSVVRVLENTDNSIIVELAGQKKLSNPDQIILVFDSSTVTFEASAAFTSKSKLEETSYAPKEYSGSMLLASLLAEEIEDEMEIEDWMLEPFGVNTTPEFLEPVAEEEMLLEPWMTDLSQWK